MQLSSHVVAFLAWMGAGTLPRTRVEGNAREGKPVARRPALPGSVLARRLALGLTQQRVADLLGIHEHTLRRLEGRRPYSRGVRSDVTRLRSRVNALYLALERERDASSLSHAKQEAA